MTFNGNDPKYRSCCCDAHVTSLSRVFICLSVFATFFVAINSLAEGDLIGLIYIPIVCLGAYAVFQQVRTPLLVYIVLSIIQDIIYVTSFVTSPSIDPHFKEIQEFIVPVNIFAVILSLPLTIFIYCTYWNLAKFIEDREKAQLLPVHYQKV